MEAKTWQKTIIKLKAVPKEIFKNKPNTIDTSMAYVAGWKDGTERQAEISFKARDAEIAERQVQYEKRIKELQETCTQWESLCKEAEIRGYLEGHNKGWNDRVNAGE